MHPFLLTKPTEASKSQKNDSKFSTKTKTKTMTFQNLNMPHGLVMWNSPLVIQRRTFIGSQKFMMCYRAECHQTKIAFVRPIFLAFKV